MLTTEFAAWIIYNLFIVRREHVGQSRGGFWLYKCSLACDPLLVWDETYDLYFLRLLHTWATMRTTLPASDSYWYISRHSACGKITFSSTIWLFCAVTTNCIDKPLGDRKTPKYRWTKIAAFLILATAPNIRWCRKPSNAIQHVRYGDTSHLYRCITSAINDR